MATAIASRIVELSASIRLSIAEMKRIQDLPPAAIEDEVDFEIAVKQYTAAAFVLAVSFGWLDELLRDDVLPLLSDFSIYRRLQ